VDAARSLPAIDTALLPRGSDAASDPSPDLGPDLGRGPSNQPDLATADAAAVEVAPSVPAAPVVTEFTVPNGPHRSIAAGKDGMYFATAANKIVRVRPNGEITEFSATLPHPLGLARGPDDNIWITNTKGDIVSRLTPAGVFAHHTITSRASVSIVSGPDQALWFTSQDLRDRGIGRITIAGGASIFKVSAGHLPTDITNGPDGALWFTLPEELHRGGKIGRITTSGAVTEIPVGDGQVPDELALAPDGRIWFTTQSRQVGFVVPGKGTAAATVRLFELSLGTRGLAAAEDGTLWFTVATRPALIRIKPNGDQNANLTQLMYKEISDGVTAPTEDIAAGPGRTLWFTTTGDKVGRVQY
jgi:virginiamycin B lyase